MSTHKCLIQLSNQNHYLPNSTASIEFHSLQKLMQEKGIEFTKCDTIPGWWNLNQDFIEFRCEAQCEWNFVRPAFLNDAQWNDMYIWLLSGGWVMLVYYIDEDGTLTPHR